MSILILFFALSCHKSRLSLLMPPLGRRCSLTLSINATPFVRNFSLFQPSSHNLRCAYLSSDIGSSYLADHSDFSLLHLLEAAKSLGGLDVNQLSNSGDTPLSSALQTTSCPEFMAALISEGADISLKTTTHKTILRLPSVPLNNLFWVVQNYIGSPSFEWNAELFELLSPQLFSAIHAKDDDFSDESSEPSESFPAQRAALWAFLEAQNSPRLFAVALQLAIQSLSAHYIRESDAFSIVAKLRHRADLSVSSPSLSLLSCILRTPQIADSEEFGDLAAAAIRSGADPFAPVTQSPDASSTLARSGNALSFGARALRNPSHQRVLELCLAPFASLPETEVPLKVADACVEILVALHRQFNNSSGEVPDALLQAIRRLARLTEDSQLPLSSASRSLLLGLPTDTAKLKEIFNLSPYELIRRLLFRAPVSEINSRRSHDWFAWRTSSFIVDCIRNHLNSALVDHGEIVKMIQTFVDMGGDPFQPAPSVLSEMTLFDMLANLLGATDLFRQCIEILITAPGVGTFPSALERKRSVLSDALITVVSMGAAEVSIEFKRGHNEESTTAESEQFLMDLMTSLINAGADVLITQPDGTTLLHIAACRLSVPKLKCSSPHRQGASLTSILLQFS